MINNAGAGYVAPLEEEDLQAARQVIATNLTAAMATAQAAGRVMLKQGRGAIINMASIYGLTAGEDPMAAYAATKGAIVNFTRELAAQWVKRGVRVNAIAPGFFPTEMTGMLQNPQLRARIERRTMMGRPGEPHELDRALLFLASDASSYVTGQTLVVDGGWTSW